MSSSRDLEKNRANNNLPNYPPNGAGGYSHSVETSERQWTSWLVPMIVVANILVFIVVMFINNCPKNIENGGNNISNNNNVCVAKFLGRFAFQPLKENPLLGPSSNTLVGMGALQWDRVVHQHQGWRLITCIWLHAGVIHLFANMLSLVLIGIRLEQQFGFLRIGALYLAAGISGSVLSSLFLQQSISVGASGALFGLLGAMLSELFTNWTIYSNKVAALVTLVFVILINLAVGILPHVDNFAHLGGFVSGFLLGFVLLLRPQFGWRERHQLPEHLRVKTKYLPYQLVLAIVALFIVVAWYTVGMVLLFKGKNGHDHCKWCHYLSCVPTSKWKCDN